jgi:hypothetical protein
MLRRHARLHLRAPREELAPSGAEFAENLELTATGRCRIYAKIAQLRQPTVSVTVKKFHNNGNSPLPLTCKIYSISATALCRS